MTGVESEKDAELNEWINEAGGEVMSMEYEGPIDYLITGLTFDPMKTFKMKPSNIWTYLFLEDCLDQGKIAGLQYFHQPITIDPDLKPGKDLVIGITGYAGKERTYIHGLGMVSHKMSLITIFGHKHLGKNSSKI